MTDEQKILNACASMTPWARGIIVELAVAYAVDFPSPPPHLQNLAVEPPSDDADEAVNSFPLLVVGKSVDR